MEEGAVPEQGLLRSTHPTATAAFTGTWGGRLPLLSPATAAAVPGAGPQPLATVTARPWLLTLHGEKHGLADVCAHPVAGLAEVVADVLLQHMADEQGAVGQDLDAAREGYGVVLLGVAASYEATQRHRAQSRQRSACEAWCWGGHAEKGLAPTCTEVPTRCRASPLPFACFHMTFGGGYPSTEQFSTPALP